MRSTQILRKLVVSAPFYAAMRVDGLQPGEHPSDFEGQGGEYLGFPELQEGEPMSAVNWRLSARTPGKFVRTEWESEKGIKVHVLVDMSADMDFGSQWLTMRELAAIIAGSLLKSAGATGDCGRVIPYSSQGLGKILPASGDWHASRLVHPAMAAIHAGGNDTTASGGIAQALRRIPQDPKALVCIIGRFDNLSKEDEAALAGSRKLHRVCIVLQDPRERNLRPRQDVSLPWYLNWLKMVPGLQQVQGANGAHVAVRTDERSATQYAQAFHEREQKLHTLFARTGCKWCTFVTAAQPEELQECLVGPDGKFQGNWLPEAVRQRLSETFGQEPFSLRQCQFLLEDDASMEIVNAYVLRRRLLRILRTQRKSGCLDGRDFSPKTNNHQPQPAAPAAL